MPVVVPWLGACVAVVSLLLLLALLCVIRHRKTALGSSTLAKGVGHYAALDVVRDPAFTVPVDKRRLLLLVGPQCAGKSTLARRLARDRGWAVVNQDILGTRRKCINSAVEALKEGRSVVIDRTNCTEEQRSSFITIARNRGVPVACLWLDLPVALCLERLRSRTGHATFNHSGRAEAILQATARNVEVPVLQEGFVAVQRLTTAAEVDAFDVDFLFGPGSGGAATADAPDDVWDDWETAFPWDEL